jgi:hypothetical protein
MKFNGKKLAKKLRIQRIFSFKEIEAGVPLSFFYLISITTN